MAIERIEELRLTADDERAIAGLLSLAFDTDFGGRSFFMQRPGLRLVWRDAGGIVAHVALHLRAVRADDRLLTVAGLADVATDPARRGQGLASTLLQAAVEEARQGPASYMLLFGDAALYAGAGFRPVTTELRFVDLTDAHTGEVQEGHSTSLMVLPLGREAWTDPKTLDLLGHKF